MDAGLEHLSLPIDAFQALIRMTPSPLAACSRLRSLRLGTWGTYSRVQGPKGLQLSPGDAAALASLLPALRLLEIEVQHERTWLLPNDKPKKEPAEAECARVAPAEAVATLRCDAPGLEIQFV